MRIILVTLALLLAAAIGAILFFENFIDRADLRDRLVARLQEVSGREVAARGGIDLRLLPRPAITVGRLSIGRRLDGGEPFRLEIDRLEAEIGFLSLFGGRLDLRTAHLVRPSLELDTAALSALAIPTVLARAFPQLERLSVVDGSLRLTGLPETVPASASGVELDLGVVPERGEVDLHAHGGWGETPLVIAASGGPFTEDAPAAVRLELTLGAGAARVSLAYRGAARFGGQGPALDGSIRLEVAEGTRLLELHRLWHGEAPSPAGAEVGPFVAEAKLVHEAGLIRLDEIALDLAGRTLEGAAALDTRAGAQLQLDLESPELVLTPELIRLAPAAASGLAPPAGLRGTLGLRLGTLVWRERRLGDLRLDLALPGDGSVEVGRASAVLPGAGDLRFQGRLSGLGDRPTGTGSLAVATQDLRGLLAWLGIEPPWLAPEQLATMSLTGEMEAASDALTLRQAEIRIDATRAVGSIALQRGTRNRLAAALRVDRLTLDPYLGEAPRLPDLGRLLPQDLDAAVDLTLDAVSWRAVRAEGVRLRADLEQGVVTLRELTLGDLAEASGTIVGRAAPAAGEFQLALDGTVARPTRLLRLFDIDAPALLIRFQPLKLTGTAHGRADSIEVELEAGVPGLDLRLFGRQSAPAADGHLDLRLEARGGSLPDFLRRLGAPLADETGLAGDLNVRAALARDAATAPVSAWIDATLGPSRLAGELLLDHGREGVPRLSGRVVAETLAPELLAATYDVLAPPLGLPTGPPALWVGNWSDEPLDGGWLFGSELDLQFTVLRLVGDASPAAPSGGRLRLRDGALAVEEATLPLASGRLTGGVTLDGRGDSPRLTAGLALTDARAESLLGLLGAAAGLSGALGLEVELAATGATPAALVRTLAGTGRLELAGGEIAGVRLTPDDDPAFGRRTRFAWLGGPFGVQGGVARPAGDGLELRFEGGSARIAGSFDLRAWLLDATIETAAADRLDLPSTTIRVLGPPGRVRIESPPAPAAP